MRVVQVIAEKARQSDLPFLIVGGYAVMAHGFVRATEDLDLLVQKSRQEQWRGALEELGMSVYRDGPTFVQFKALPDSRLPVDLMLVGDDVFGRMNAQALTTTLGAVSVRVVSLLGLIALKCHALQHTTALRNIKDMDDWIHLIKLNALDLNEAKLKATILKQANQELYDKLRRACAAD